MNRTLILLFLSIFLNAYGQENLKKEIENTYNFHPHNLSKEEQNEKIPSLDKFFEMIKSDTTKYLPLLRQELKSNDHLPYFYFDCSYLLMMLSKSQSDKELSAEAFSKCSTKGLDPKSYVVLLKSLANDNINITKAALNILDDPKFQFYIIEHGAFNFKQSYCLTYCLLPLDPIMYVDSLIEYFNRTDDITAQKSIITTLWFSFSCNGDKFLKTLKESNNVKKEVSDYAQQLLLNNKLDNYFQEMLNSITELKKETQNNDKVLTDEKVSKDKLDNNIKELMNKITEEEIENLKKSALKRFSDEAIHDLDFVTKVRRQKFNCR